jgi:large subunit ribosomal protein L4
MAQITIKTPSGADAGSVELDDAVFGIQPNVPVMHQVVTAQLAKRRAGTQSTKTRSEVRGGGAKPYRQKGTGNARQGSTNSPHYTGGGIALGPKPRSYAQRTPKKMIKLATRSALSDRASEGRVVVIDGWGFDAPKTKAARSALGALGVDGPALVVIDSFQSPVALSFRNLPEVQLIKVGELNAYDILCNDWIVFERSLLPTADAPAVAPDSVNSGVEPEVEQLSVHPQEPAEGAREDDDDPSEGAVHPTEPAEGGDDADAGASDSTDETGGDAATEDGDHSA